MILMQKTICEKWALSSRNGYGFIAFCADYSNTPCLLSDEKAGLQ